MKSRSAALLSILALFSVVAVATSAANAQITSTPAMVKDIGTDNDGSDDMAYLMGDVRIFMDGNIAYFPARSTGGDGLWKSDGTAAGTVLIASATDLGGVSPSHFVKVGPNIYFTVVDLGGTNETLVKKYDGTTVTTVANSAAIKASVSGTATIDNYGVSTQFLWSAGGNVYFVAYYEVSGSVKYDLFRYTGTTLQKATSDEVGSAGDIGPVFELNGTTHYLSYTDSSGFASIPSSGSRKQTSAGGVDFYYAQQGRVVVLPGTPDRAYMLMMASSGSYSVVSYDGTTVAPVTDGTTRISYAGLPTLVGSRVYFQGSDNDAGNDALFYTSSTAATEVTPTYAFNFTGIRNVGMHGSLNGSLYLFFQTNSSRQLELWRSDGTDAGTYSLANSFVGDSSANAVSYLYAAEGEIFFPSATTSGGTVGMRKSDGTIAGTGAAFVTTPEITVIRYFAQGTSVVFFIAQTTGFGMELHAVAPNNISSTTTTSPTTTTTSSPTTTGGGTSNSSVPSKSEISKFKSSSLVPGGVVEAGSRVTVNASGFTPSETVNAILQGSTSSIGRGKASSTGKASIAITVPTNTRGTKTLVLYGTTSRYGVRQTITITMSPSVLPATGGQPTAYAWIGMVILLTGLAVRRTRRITFTP